MRKYFATLALGTMMLAFNQVDHLPSEREQQGMESVNEASRVANAKELLGESYDSSPAQTFEGANDLHLSIYRKVQSRLEGKWKSHAQSVSQMIIKQSSEYQFDPVFVMAVIQTESKFNPSARGSHGEIGLMQLRPETGEWIADKFDIPWEGVATLENPATNIRLGIAYMSYLRLRFQKSSDKYVSAYNMGPLNVQRLAEQNVRPLTYSTKVLRNYRSLYSSLAVSRQPAMIPPILDAQLHF